MAQSMPTAGHPIPRGSKPYIWATHLAKILGGQQCLWSVWFKAHFRYVKVVEEEGPQLAEWNRAHTRMMRDRVQELAEAGWAVRTEDQNEFKLKGESAIVAGKPDIVATMPGHMLIVDGKTGKERDGDFWQVLIYLFAWVKTRRVQPPTKLSGEVHYQAGDHRVSVRLSDLAKGENDIVRLIKVVAGATPPQKTPSRFECKRCNIGAADCSARFQEREPAMPPVSDF